MLYDLFLKFYFLVPPTRGVGEKIQIQILMFTKSQAVYLKIEASYGNFCKSRLGKISISQNFDIFKFNSIFEIFAPYFAGWFNFLTGPTYKNQHG